MKGSEYIAQTLLGHGVEYAFVVPMNLFGTLLEAERHGLQPVLCHSEAGAVYMADGYARASGKPGVVVTQSGPGASNASAALADPAQASSPVIVLSGGIVSPQQIHRHGYQEVVPHFEDVTKFNAIAPSPDRVRDLLPYAFRAATSGIPGPVHLGISAAFDHAEIDGEPVRSERFGRYPAYRPAPEAGALEEALTILRGASRPVMVIGGGATTSGAGQQLLEFVEREQVPFATTLSGKGLLPDSHRLAVGVPGTYGRKVANEIVSDADLVMFVGTRTGAQSTSQWTVPPVDTPVIHVNIEPTELGRSYPKTHGLWGDARETVAALNRLGSDAEPPDRSEWTQEVERRTRSWWEAVRPFATSDQQPIRPERLCAEVTEAIPSDALLVTDTGYCAAWIGTLVEMRGAPGTNFIRCEGSLGWGIPGTIGVKCATPDRPVIGFSGDGGFFYHGSELETAARLGLNVTIVVMDNRELAFETHVIDYSYERGGSRTLSEFLPTVDIAKVAEGYGANAIRVEDPAAIGDALREAIAMPGPTVVAVRTDPEPAAPVVNWEAALGGRPY
jgi:acetolactate synthase I/II/III large subunit